MCSSDLTVTVDEPGRECERSEPDHDRNEHGRHAIGKPWAHDEAVADEQVVDRHEPLLVTFVEHGRLLRAEREQRSQRHTASRLDRPSKYRPASRNTMTADATSRYRCSAPVSRRSLSSKRIVMPVMPARPKNSAKSDQA